LVCAASAAALTGIVIGCDDEDVVVGVPAEAGAGGAGGSGGMDAAAGSGGTDGAAGAGGAAGSTASDAGVLVTMANLVSDQTGVAGNTDPKLINAWGLAINPNAPGGPAFWVANEGSGTATVYDRTGVPQPVTVTIPVPGNATVMGSPTGQVFNDSAAVFMGDRFILSTTEGAIVGWQSGVAATVRADNSASEAAYTGLTMIDISEGRVLAAADFHNNKVDTFSSTYGPAAVVGDFMDPSMPSDFAPFNVAFLDGKIYVAYAKQDADKQEEEAGPGLGYISVFQANGTFSERFISEGALNAPWAMTMAPSSYGSLAGTLLVGNFGDGRINAYDKVTGDPRGQLMDASGQPLVIEGLWALVPGPTMPTLDLSQTLYFTAGPGDEAHGVFGAIRLR